MALGVLNNLSAIYAQHNLNNTSNSLQTVLRQLSSGSRISSGADDAAGSSLVNGLQANSTALSQSVTNATEGIGLLQVADGALMQVNNLLNRAITLATEASNGTLNANQSAAANQEYQSILAEINNIGSTTTYNQQPVFADRTVSIYTGDSSTAGSSIDNIYIRGLSARNIGDTNGKITYSNGQNNVFINLSNGGKNAAITDSLGPITATTTITVSYINKGANGSAVASTANISAGAGTIYANTVQGLMDAVNNSGLGVNASFTTAAAAGSAAVAAAAVADLGAGSPTNTGIAIAATGIGTGTAGVGVVGALSLPVVVPPHSLGGTLTVVSSDGTSHNITLGTVNSTDTLSNLQSTINAAGYGVTASINQAGDKLTFTTANPNVIVSATSLMNVAPAVPTKTVITGSELGSLSVQAVTDTLSGTLNMVEGVDALATPLTLALGTSGTTDTLANLMATINANVATYGIKASTNAQAVGTPGQPGYHATDTVLTFTKDASDAGTPSITGTALAAKLDLNVAQGSTLGSMTVLGLSDTLTGSLTGTTAAGGSYAIPLGVSGSTDTISNLMATMNSTYASLGISVSRSNNTLTFTQTPGLTGSPSATGTFTDTTAVSYVAGAGPATDLGSIAIGALSDKLSGTLSGLADDGSTVVSVGLGAVGSTDTVANLLTYFNTTNSAWGITAAYNAGALSFTSSAGLATLTGAGLTDTAVVATPVSAGSLLNTLTVDAPGDALTGNLTVTSALTGLPTTLALGTLNTTDTLANLATTLSAYGLSATTNAAAIGTSGQPGYHAAGTVLTISEAVGNLGNGNTAAVTNAAPLGDEVVTSLTSSTNLGVLTIGNTADTLTGTLKGVKGDGSATAYQIDLIGKTLPQLAAMINTDPSYGITATLNQAGDALTFTTTPLAAGKPTLFNVGNITTTLPASPASISLTEVPTPGAANSTQLGSLAISSADTLSGSLMIGSHAISIGLTNNSGATLADAVNKGDYGVTASYDSIAGIMTFTSTNSAMVIDSDPTLLQATPAGGSAAQVAFKAAAITSSDYYSIGITGSVTDNSTGGGTGNVGITTDSNGLGGVATTSYSDAPGVNLSTTYLTNQTEAQAALNSINLAITSAAALDGYIGGQINMLNSVSQVLTTQRENVISAQNAIQATDYASAAADLSKYQILSQTGIAALAQANSIQQEVTKLLQ